MNKSVLLHCESIVVDSAELMRSSQSQVFFGICPDSNERLVVKQFDLNTDIDALVKELQVISIMNNLTRLPKDPKMTDIKMQIKQIAGSKSRVPNIPKVLSVAFTDKVAELMMEDCGMSLKQFYSTPEFKL